MARMQGHHISYDPEWVVDIGMLMHRTISRVQITKATPTVYADLTNFMHAVTYEWNRVRKELDIDGDQRNLKPKKQPKKRVITRRLKQ